MSYVRLQITHGAPEQILQKLTQAGITVYRIKSIDLLNIRLDVDKSGMDTAVLILEKYGAEYKILHMFGLYFFFGKMIKRPVLVIGILLLAVLVIYLPSRVLFVAVKGNETIPTRYILDKAESCGIAFGGKRKMIRNEKIKNALLSEIPELQWVGVNTYGCLVVISVEERTPNDPEEHVDYHTNLVATHDAVITEMSVLRGVALCKPGQAVRKGQVLISGYSDVGLCIRLTGAEGEIRGYTQRSLKVKTMTEYTTKVKQRNIKRRYSIFFGKKLINFDKGSGISGTFCDRMYTEYYLVLPGGLSLPVGIMEETTISYETEEVSDTDLTCYSWLEPTAEDYLSNQMIAGQIMRKDTQISLDGEICCLYGIYRCHELIGQIRYEEMLEQYG